jgi:hypothetical protein
VLKYGCSEIVFNTHSIAHHLRNLSMSGGDEVNARLIDENIFALLTLFLVDVMPSTHHLLTLRSCETSQPLSLLLPQDLPSTWKSVL